MSLELENNKKSVKTKEKDYIELSKKYKRYFERGDKDIIIKQIKDDLKDDLGTTDIEILANNIYEYCCLVVANIKINEISKYALAKNKYIYNLLSDKEKEFYNNDWLNKITNIKDKYIKKITP